MLPVGVPASRDWLSDGLTASAKTGASRASGSGASRFQVLSGPAADAATVGSSPARTRAAHVARRRLEGRDTEAAIIAQAADLCTGLWHFQVRPLQSGPSGESGAGLGKGDVRTRPIARSGGSRDRF